RSPTTAPAAPTRAASGSARSPTASRRSAAGSSWTAPPAAARASARASRCSGLHPLGRLHPDEVESAREHGARRLHQREPERLLLALEHTVLVVEAVEVVGELDRVLGHRLRAAALGRLPHHGGEVRQ